MTGVFEKDILDYESRNSNEMTDNQTAMEAILTRDQRTTSHRVSNGRTDIETSTPESFPVRVQSTGQSAKVSASSGLDTTTGTKGCQSCSSEVRNGSSERIRGYTGCRRSTVTWLRLGSLLVTLLVASIHAAPTMTSDPRNDVQEKWVSPCGPTTVYPEADAPRQDDQVLFSQIWLSANQALVDTEIFRDRFIQENFNSNLAKMQENWNSHHYDWLPSTEEIPKALNEQLDQGFLDKLDSKTALINAHQYMQKYAVALEQVVWDQKDHKPDFTAEFTRTEYMLRGVLCEIQTAIQEHQIKPQPDASRSIMKDVVRKDAEQRDLRDWLIFRDYMNGLEYVAQVFDHLRKRIKS